MASNVESLEESKPKLDFNALNHMFDALYLHQYIVKLQSSSSSDSSLLVWKSLEAQHARVIRFLQLLCEGQRNGNFVRKELRLEEDRRLPLYAEPTFYKNLAPVAYLASKISGQHTITQQIINDVLKIWDNIQRDEENNNKQEKYKTQEFFNAIEQTLINNELTNLKRLNQNYTNVFRISLMLGALLLATYILLHVFHVVVWLSVPIGTIALLSGIMFLTCSSFNYEQQKRLNSTCGMFKAENVENQFKEKSHQLLDAHVENYEFIKEVHSSADNQNRL